MNPEDIPNYDVLRSNLLIWYRSVSIKAHQGRVIRRAQIVERSIGLRGRPAEKKPTLSQIKHLTLPGTESTIQEWIASIAKCAPFPENQREFRNDNEQQPGFQEKQRG